MPNRESLPPSLIREMPPPSVELTLAGVLMRAHMRTLPRRKRREYLLAVMEALEEFEMNANVVRLRPASFDEDVAETRRQATAWVRGMTASFFMADMIRDE